MYFSYIPIYGVIYQAVVFDRHSAKSYNFPAETINGADMGHSKHYILFVLIKVKFVPKIACNVTCRICHPSHFMFTGLCVHW